MISSQKRIRRIKWLMILSSLLLTILLIEWVRTLYEEEERKFGSEVEIIIQNTVLEHKDAILSKLIDSIAGPKARIISNTASVSTRLFDNEEAAITHKNSNNKTFDSLYETASGVPEAGSAAPSQEPTDATEQYERITLTYTDSTQFKQELVQHLDKLFTRQYINWISKNSGNTHPSMLTIEFPSESIFIEGYEWHLIRKNIPQILFAAMVCILVPLAFRQAYRSMKQQVQFSIEKDHIMSNISHELKTPVATTRVVLEALTAYNGIEDKDKSVRYLKVALWEMERLETMIDKVLNITISENKFLELKLKKTDLISLLQEISAKMQPHVTEKGAILALGFPQQEIYAGIDLIHFTNALYNIIDNALKYGGNKIHIGLIEQSNTAIINIRDNGSGIPAIYRSKIFEKFFRIPSTMHNVKGYGLGLNYTRQIITSHNGQINLADTTTTCFVITLPVLH